MTYIIFILVAIGAISVAFMDVSSEGNFSKDWMNKGNTWRLKWKNGDPKQGESFTFSSTFLVWLTDFWHFCKMIFNNCWQISISLFLDNSLMWFIVIKLSFGIIFESTYKILKK